MKTVVLTRVGGPFPADMVHSEVRGVEGHYSRKKGKTSGSLGREEGVGERLWVD